MTEVLVEDEETSEELKKKAPQLPGLELEKIIRQHKPMEPDPEVMLFVPFAAKTDLKPADTYKKDVEAIAKKGIDENYLLLASIRKLSEKYNAAAVADLKHYTHEGMTEEIAKDKEKAQKLLKENYEKHKKTLETIVKNTDAAWENPDTPAFVTPPHAQEAYEDATNTIPDEKAVMLQNSAILQQFIAMNGSRKDKMLYAEGSRFYAARYKKVKNDKGEEGLALDYVEVWKKKD
jgi:hypothetical protein